MFLLLSKKERLIGVVSFSVFYSERSKVSASSIKALALLEARSELLVTVLLLEDDDLIINSSI